MCGGVGKSGWPMPRLMMSRPWRASSVARASTAKAFSSPMREKAGTMDGMADRSLTRPSDGALHVGMAKIIALEQERRVMRHRGRVGEAIAEVEPGRMSGFTPVAAVGFEGDAGLAFVGAEQSKG